MFIIDVRIYSELYNNIILRKHASRSRETLKRESMNSLRDLRGFNVR